MRFIRTIILIVSLLYILTGCKTSAPSFNYQELARASIRLNMDIDMEDNHHLYIAASQWLGTHYQNGGNSKRGVDCSGLTSQIYKEVYRKKLRRSADEQYRKNCNKISKSKLREGDLVFFHNGKRKKRATHVGIYLKNNHFIHASTSQGVIISNLNEIYWRNHWISGGRP